MAGGWEVRGPLEQVVEALTANAPVNTTSIQPLKMAFARRNSLWHARHNVHYHYDLAIPFRRAWELYLAGSQAAFATGCMQLFQVVFVPRESPPPAWTRADVYGSKRISP